MTDKFPGLVEGTDNLAWMLRQADDIDWNEGQTAYRKYNQIMTEYADKYGYSLEKTTAAFCALSPNNDYVGNLRSLTSVFEGLANGVDPDDIVISTYNHCKHRAIHYLTGAAEFDSPKRGPKILSFYKNIINPECPEHVTIDGHIAAAFCGDPNLVMKDVLMTRGIYRRISAGVNHLANEMNLLPNQLQAIIWFTRKRIYKIKYVPIIDLFAEPDDVWRILIPLDELPPYPIKVAL